MLEPQLAKPRGKPDQLLAHAQAQDHSILRSAQQLLEWHVIIAICVQNRKGNLITSASMTAVHASAYLMLGVLLLKLSVTNLLKCARTCQVNSGLYHPGRVRSHAS